MIINQMLIGAIAMASATVSLFFIRFWRRTKDSFFLCFAVSFLLNGLTRLIMGASSLQESSSLIYVLRMFAYILIIYAIYMKNKSTL